jgi:hypothetical protein
MKTRNEIIDKIEKIMRRTQEGAGASEAEVENALGLARKLMDQHNIDMAEIIAAGEKTLDEKDILDVQLDITFGPTEERITHVAAQICDCKVYKVTGGYFVNKTGPNAGLSTRKSKLHIYGINQDVTAARVLVMELYIAVKVLGKQRTGRASGKEFWHYCEGFTLGLLHKANTMRQRSEDEAVLRGSNSTALILRKDKVINDYEVAVLHLKPAKPRKLGAKVLSDAYQAGMRDGKNYDLSGAERNRSGKIAPDQKRLN